MHEIVSVDIRTATQITGVGRTSIYAAIKRGELPIRKVGRRTVILATDVKRWIESRPGSDQEAA